MDISIMEALEKTSALIRDWTKTKLAAGLDGKVDSIPGKSLSTNDYTTADKNRVKNMATQLILEDGKLCLGNDSDEVVSNWISLPSGGGAGPSTPGGDTSNAVTLKPIGSTSLTVAQGKPANISFNFDSSEAPGYDGTMLVYVGTDPNAKGTESIKNGNNTIDISKYLDEGVNDVKIVCKDIYSNQKSLSYTVYVVALKISSNFNANRAYTDDINFIYTLEGAVDKTVHFVLDGKDTPVNKGTEVGEKEQTISIRTHGVHTLQVYVTAVISGVTVPSNTLTYDIIYAVPGYTDPIISSVYTAESIQQGELINIPFFIYDPNNSTVDVQLTIKNGNDVYATTTRTGVGQVLQTWSTRNYPVGDNVTFTIEIVNNSGFYKTHKIKVIPSTVNVSVKTDFREFQLVSDGKSNSAADKDQWTDGNVTTTFSDVNWTNTGWIPDDEGDIALRLSGKARATINFQPLAGDSLTTGKTIEMKFAIRDVNNRSTEVIKCHDGTIGFTVKSDTATLSSRLTNIKCQYADEEKVHLAFVITNTDNYCLMYIYLNGVLSAVKQYPSTDSLTQNPAQYIEIGSEDCSVDLYMIRSYRTALNKEDIKNNYIANIANMAEKIGVYADNDIYDQDKKLSFKLLKSKIPVLVITGDLPMKKGDKKKVDISYTDPFNSQFDYEESAVSIDVQGTSSQYYIRKNYKIKTNEEHQFAISEMPGKVFTFKADYAEATSTHNTGNANYVHTLYGDAKVPPQVVDSRVRTTIYGHPCVIFHKKTSTSTPEFLGKYNYNWDKGAENVYGFTKEYDPDGVVQSWEFKNNDTAQCKFLATAPADWQDHLFLNEETGKWEPKYFEARYPDGCEDFALFKRMHDWVVSTKGDVEKFKNEFHDYFDLNFCLLYYVYTFVMLMVDQRAKNMFLTTWDGIHWLPYFYDNDTCLGINNEGQLVFDYYHEDDDQFGDGDVYNGADSTLWVNFRQAFAAEIQQFYQDLRRNNKLTYDKIIEYFITRQSDKWSISIYNEDSDYKYISMARDPEKPDTGNLNQVRGTGEEHLKHFVKNRLMYCDSKWNAVNYEDDYIAFRVYTPNNWQGVEPNADIWITPYSNIYAGVRFKANGQRVKHRLTAGVPQLFEPPANESFDSTLDSNENSDFNDTEAAIYGASELSSLGDLSSLYLGYLDISKATRLTELIIGSGAQGYQNTFFGAAKGLSIGANNLLRKVDVRNCPNFTDTLDLSKCPNIQEVYATGSGITGVSLPESGYLRQLHLPGTIAGLTIKNQQHIAENGFSCESYNNLSELHIENATNIPIEAIINAAQGLQSVRLVGVTWQSTSEEELQQTINKFKTCNGRNDDGSVSTKAVVRGRVKVPSISDALFADIYDNFKDLVVETEDSGTKCVVRYLKYNGTTLDTKVLNAGDSIVDPIAAGYFTADAVVRPSDDEGKMQYIFTGWDNLINNVQTHMDVRPLYKKQYSVNFYKDDEFIVSNLHHVQWIDEGGSSTNPINNTTVFAPIKEGTNNSNYDFADWKKYEFSHWSNLPQDIRESQNVYALYDTYYPVYFYNGNTLYNEQWIIDGGSAISPSPNPEKASTVEFSYSFSGWNVDFTNIQGPTKVYANYKDTTRSYPVYFHYYDGSAEQVHSAGEITYNNTAIYGGNTPVKQLSASDIQHDYTSADYEWTGKWSPEPIPKTGNITKVNNEESVHCYPVFRFKKVHEDDWDTIAYNVQTMSDEDLFQRYPIGTRKDISFTIGEKTYNSVVEIIAHNHDNLADGSGKAKLTFFTNELPDITSKMGSTTDIGWGCGDSIDTSSNLRLFLQTDLFNGLPDKLKAAIKPVKKKYNNGYDPAVNIVESIDTCWCASDKELGLITYNADGTIAGSLSYAFIDGQGEMYSSTFSDNKSRLRFVSGTASANTVPYWTRSAYKPKDGAKTHMFWHVNASGGCNGTSSGTHYIAFGFCI